MTEFTKGKWQVGMSRGSYSVSSLMDTTKSSRVCDLDYYGNNKANAHLIAAAPDMYLALLSLSKSAVFRDNHQASYIDNLLAKARGDI